ncbi:hypothetical protein MC885_013451 [Smutsia gigantea]|nr:hypothetical protein MC885_013451 [Smutsia gigantea]
MVPDFANVLFPSLTPLVGRTPAMATQNLLLGWGLEPTVVIHSGTPSTLALVRSASLGAAVPANAREESNLDLGDAAVIGQRTEDAEAEAWGGLPVLQTPEPSSSYRESCCPACIMDIWFDGGG